MTLIEIMTVVGIVGMLFAIGAFSIASARSAGRSAAAIATAQAYADAADQFAREHSGRYPSASPSTDWPGGTLAARGPAADVLGVKKYYMPAAPEAVQDGSIKLVAAGSPTSGASIEYIPEGAGGRGYRFVVRVAGRPDCALRGGGATSTTPRACSAR